MKTKNLANPTGTIPVGLWPAYYPANLTDDELDEVLDWARFCLMGRHPARRLCNYLCSLVQFETARRSMIDEGGEVVEVNMPCLPCHRWPNEEVAAALAKLSAVCFTTDGEVCELFKKIHSVVEVEATHRLGLNKQAGTAEG